MVLVYMLTFGVYWWDPWSTIYSSTMDPSWVFRHTCFPVSKWPAGAGTRLRREISAPGKNGLPDFHRKVRSVGDVSTVTGMVWQWRSLGPRMDPEWIWMVSIVGEYGFCHVFSWRQDEVLETSPVIGVSRTWSWKQKKIEIACCLGPWDDYPLVNVYITMENHHF